VLELPRRRAIEAINRPISHGYAYHSLTPETFIHAALTLRRRFKPRRAFIVGLRGAGTSLSAIVASTLTIRGVICESLTVRAHNEAIAPYVDLDPALLHRWRSYEDAVFIVVGEGPDETGGTFAAAIDTLLHAGADPQRVIVVSSAPLDDAKQASPRTRALFARVQQVSSSFEEAWLDTHRLISGDWPREELAEFPVAPQPCFGGEEDVGADAGLRRVVDVTGCESYMDFQYQGGKSCVVLSRQAQERYVATRASHLGEQAGSHPDA